MKLIPLNDKVLVLPVSVQKVSPGGIVIPDSAEGKATRGVVIAKGHTVDSKLGANTGDPYMATNWVKEGTEVMFPAYAGVEVDIDNVKHRLIPAEELLGVVEAT